MEGTNRFGRQMTPDEIAAGRHREAVGGMWDDIGRLQFDFLRTSGLLPGHRFLDVGCGCLRGGVHFVKYLDPGNYYGLDINPSLIEAGKMELSMAGLSERKANLLVNDQFEFSKFGTDFEYALALSVFTHLFQNYITRCLVEIRKVLKPTGRFYATFFQAPGPAHLGAIHHEPGGITTNYDSDPFHISFAEVKNIADMAGLSVELIGEWQHPRDQRMLCFRVPQ